MQTVLFCNYSAFLSKLFRKSTVTSKEMQLIFNFLDPSFTFAFTSSMHGHTTLKRAAALAGEMTCVIGACPWCDCCCCNFS